MFFVVSFVLHGFCLASVSMTGPFFSFKCIAGDDCVNTDADSSIATDDAVGLRLSDDE